MVHRPKPPPKPVLVESHMTRGDSATVPFAIPIGTYSTGAKVFFALKPAADVVQADLDDALAVLVKTITDADLVASDDTTAKHYSFDLVPADTNDVAPGVYLAELEFVSEDGSVVLSWPDPEENTWEFTISPDVNRRTA